MTIFVTGGRSNPAGDTEPDEPRADDGINDELCIKNMELCIKNEELCIKNDELCIKTDEFCSLHSGQRRGGEKHCKQSRVPFS